MGYATLILLLLMMPVFFTGGLTGAFLHPLAQSYGLAVIASAVVRAHRHPGPRARPVLPRRPGRRASTAPRGAPRRPPPPVSRG